MSALDEGEILARIDARHERERRFRSDVLAEMTRTLDELDQLEADAASYGSTSRTRLNVSTLELRLVNLKCELGRALDDPQDYAEWRGFLEQHPELTEADQPAVEEPAKPERLDFTSDEVLDALKRVTEREWRGRAWGAGQSGQVANELVGAKATRRLVGRVAHQLATLASSGAVVRWRPTRSWDRSASFWSLPGVPVRDGFLDDDYAPDTVATDA